jgi:hypothetical protein
MGRLAPSINPEVSLGSLNEAMGSVVTDLQDLSRRLFAAADQLWTNTALRPDQYAQPVLALIALRQMEAKFEAVDAELRKMFKGRLKPTPADYQARCAIFLSDNAASSAATQGRRCLRALDTRHDKRTAPLEPFDDSRGRNSGQLTMCVAKARVLIAQCERHQDQLGTMKLPCVSATDPLRRERILAQPIGGLLVEQRLNNMQAVEPAISTY